PGIPGFNGRTSMRASLTRMAAATAVLVSVALLHLSCGKSSPSSSTPPVTVRPGPPVTGSTDTFNDTACAPGQGHPGARCDRTRGQLVDAYETAIDLLVQQKPTIFDLHDEAVADTRTYKVLDKDAYMDGLVQSLRAAHLCAERDPDDGAQQMIKLKNT